MNPKAMGEKGQCIVIGELAKQNIQCAIPLSDNLPFDLILIYENHLIKSQVKTSKFSQKQTEGSISFDLTTNNWHKKETKKYKKGEIDAFLLCDYENVYVLCEEEFLNRRSFTIRTVPSKNKQTKNCNMSKDYLLSDKTIRKCIKGRL
jgi:hypothetical protein